MLTICWVAGYSTCVLPVNTYRWPVRSKSAIVFTFRRSLRWARTKADRAANRNPARMIFCHMAVKHWLHLHMGMRNARFLHAGVAELVDAQDLGSREKKLDGGVFGVSTVHGNACGLGRIPFRDRFFCKYARVFHNAQRVLRSTK
jgi:hypothetical protein